MAPVLHYLLFYFSFGQIETKKQNTKTFWKESSNATSNKDAFNV